jgi:hypothetical protein
LVRWRARTGWLRPPCPKRDRSSTLLTR